MTTVPNLQDNITIQDTDELPIQQGALLRRMQLGELRSHFGLDAGGLTRWTVIDPAKYNSTPASTSQISFSDTSDITQYLPVRAQQSGVYRYGFIDNFSVNSNIRFMGAPLSGTIESLELGTPDLIEHVELAAPGLYNGSTTTTLLLSVANAALRWKGTAGYLLQASAWSRTITTTGPTLNVRFGGQRALTTALQPNPAQAWVDSPYADADLTHYSIAHNEAIELELISTGGGDANDLIVSLLMVRP